MTRASLADEIAAVRTLCGAIGLGAVEPVLLGAAHHTILALPPSGLVARVQSAEPAAVAHATAVRELAVARHLVARGAPVVAPPAERFAGPHVLASAVVSLWPHVEGARTADDTDAPIAAATLDAVHRGLRDYAGDLPSYTRTLDRCWRVLTDGAASRAVSATDRTLLATQYRRLRGAIAGTPGDPVPLHGDAHLGNLLIGTDGPRWIDFEDACIGPRELDIACLPEAAWRSFEDADRTLIGLCADLKSVCVAIWCSADASRSAEMRAAAGYHLDRVRRFAGRPTPPAA